MIELPKCSICQGENRFLIQKDIDDGELLPTNISEKYNISKSTIETHIKNNHREALISFGIVDYTMRKKAINTGEILSRMIEKWAESIEERTEFKDADVIKAIELYHRICGNITDKHEVKVTRTVDEALQEALLGRKL